MSKADDEGLIKALKDRVKDLEDMLGIAYPDGFPSQGRNIEKCIT